MIHRFLAVVFAGLLVAGASSAPAGSAATTNAEPQAAAWAISLVLGSAGQVMQVGQTQASSGSRPNATATAFMAGGQGTGQVVADAAHPSVSKNFQSFVDPNIPVCLPPIPGQLDHGLCDPGGNFAITGGFANAQTGGDTSSANAGIANGNGNGFAFASKNFSFDQQTQVLNAIQQLDDVLSNGTNGLPGVNTLIDQLNAATGTLPKLPHLTGPPPAGLIDLADTGALSSNSQTSSSPGFISATSSSSLGDVKLIGGFIELHNVKAEADSESNSGTDSRSSKATIGSMSIAGLNVVGDSDGLHLASNDLVTRAAVQPALDNLMSALKSSGLTITVAATKALGDLREATAFELNWVTPGGLVHISVGHAEATAQTAILPVTVPPVISGNSGPPPVIPPAPAPGINVPGVNNPGQLYPPTSNGGSSSNFFYRRPGRDVARALHTVYLIFLVAGLIGSLLYPMIVKRAPALRRRPLLV